MYRDFQDIDFTQVENQLYRFLIVDAHTLQLPEIHADGIVIFIFQDCI
ncbi:hypothetical protein [Seonamhaeicola marinus]|nr:hypothetical protein [Seonamhaeicola marinus]